MLQKRVLQHVFNRILSLLSQQSINPSKYVKKGLPLHIQLINFLQNTLLLLDLIVLEAGQIPDPQVLHISDDLL